MTDDQLGVILWALIVVLVALPCKYDPEIRLKEWVTKRSKQ
jgi:hypothetical protein